MKNRQGEAQSLPVEFALEAAVLKEFRPKYRETVYRIIQDGCSFSLTIGDSEPDAVVFRSSCPFLLQTKGRI
jgi:hypothetical protein